MKVYNEKEIGSILKRASELSHDDVNSGSMGLSLDELEQLGAEAGISPALIRKAAAEMAVGKTREHKTGFFGRAPEYSNEVLLDTEITSETWEEMLTSIRTCFKEPGTVSTRENIYEWTLQATGQKAQVTARIDNGKTRVNVFWSEPATPVPFMIPTLIGTIISLPITFEALDLSGFPGAAVILGTAATLFTLGRWGISSYVDRHSNRFDSLMAGFELLGARTKSASLSNAAKSKSQLPDEIAEYLDIPEEEELSDPVESRQRDRA